MATYWDMAAYDMYSEYLTVNLVFSHHGFGVGFSQVLIA